MKKRIISSIALLLILGIVGQQVNTYAATKKAKPQLSRKKVVMQLGGQKKLKLKKVQKNAKVKWKSSNKKVVKVTKKGNLIAKKAGKAVIKVTVKQKNTKTILKCKVIVKKNLDETLAAKKNQIFDDVENNVISINYWKNDQFVKISDTNKISKIINYLSSLELEAGINPEKDGGRMIGLITSNKTIHLTLYENDLLYDGKYYKLKDENIDITSAIMNLLVLGN